MLCSMFPGSHGFGRWWPLMHTQGSARKRCSHPRRRHPPPPPPPIRSAFFRCILTRNSNSRYLVFCMSRCPDFEFRGVKGKSHGCSLIGRLSLTGLSRSLIRSRYTSRYEHLTSKSIPAAERAAAVRSPHGAAPPSRRGKQRGGGRLVALKGSGQAARAGGVGLTGGASLLDHRKDLVRRPDSGGRFLEEDSMKKIPWKDSARGG